MAFPTRLLADHERLVLDIRPHWIALVAPAVVTILVIVAEAIVFIRFDPGGVAGWLIAAAGSLIVLIYPVRAFLAWATSHFVVTSDRVIHRSGWLAKRSMEMPLERINDVRFQQTILERMVGAGDLVIESGGEYGQNHFRDIRKPEDVQKLIYEMTEANEHRPGASEGQRDTEAIDTAEISAAATRGEGSPLDEIERLASLHERGLITDEEFETQKRRLLGRL